MEKLQMREKKSFALFAGLLAGLFGLLVVSSPAEACPNNNRFNRGFYGSSGLYNNQQFANVVAGSVTPLFAQPFQEW